MTAARTPPKVPRPTPAPRVPSPLVAALAARLAAGADASAAVDDFWRGAGARAPLVEPVAGAPHERIVTFVWRDAHAEEVLLFVNRLTDERRLGDSLLERVAGTDLWHLSYRMTADWRASYAFLVRAPGERAPWRDDDGHAALRRALDAGLPDPRNPATGRSRDGAAQSVVSLPEAPAATWLAPRGEPARPRPAAGPGGRRVWLHPPAGGVGPATPVVVALDGEVWTGSQDLPTTIDNLVADGVIRPPLVVLPDSGGRARRWDEMGTGGAVAWVADELLPWVHGRFDVSRSPADTVVIGQSLGALTALRLGIERPDAVGRVLSQSASLWQDDLAGAIGAGDLSGQRVQVQVGTQEWVLHAPNLELVERLRAAGAAVDLAEYNGGHDYACWRVGVATGLRSLLAA